MRGNDRLRKPVLLGALVALVAGVSGPARATNDLPGVNLEKALEDDAGTEGEKGARILDSMAQGAGLNGETVGPAGSFSTEDDQKPSSGTGLYDRMGLQLPDLPPEKAYKGKVDDAYGAFQRGFYLEALDAAIPRAQLGDPAAQTLIAEILARGLGVKKDLKKAAFWYGKGADGGDPNAMFKYSLLLMEGGLVPQDKKKADELMRKAADAGNPLAEFNWAQIIVSTKPGPDGLREALPYYEKSAEKGIADAEYALSQIYLNLPGLPAEKRASAKDWLLRAAKAGYDTAQFDMGLWLIDGIEFPRDYEAGFNWMLRAATAGNVAAQNKLAYLYVQAIGTRPDPIEAAKWYVMSRRAGREDPKLEDFYQGLTDAQQKAAIEAANRQQRVFASR